jgi:hypothetical protein
METATDQTDILDGQEDAPDWAAVLVELDRVFPFQLKQCMDAVLIAELRGELAEHQRELDRATTMMLSLLDEEENPQVRVTIDETV